MGVDFVSARGWLHVLSTIPTKRRESVRRRLSREKAFAPRHRAEGLEKRLFLSVSATMLEGPITTQGNSWTYSYAAENGTETQTVAGLTTIGVMPVEQESIVDAVNGKTVSTGANYYTVSASGYFSYGSTSTSITTGATQTTTYSPNALQLPASLDAGVPVTTPTAMETDTVTSPGGSPSLSYETVSSTITLSSQMPSVVAAGTTYSCYQVNVSQITIQTDSTFMTPQGLPTTDNSEFFFSPTVGLVETIDTTTNLTVLLSKFTGTADYLQVATQPSNTTFDDTINPAVTVDLRVNTTGALDTDPAAAVNITASINPGSPGAGTLLGQTMATTVDGVATFSDLSINKPGAYTLLFTASNGLTVTSSSFAVGTGKLVFEFIKDSNAGLPLDPAVIVKLENSKNKVITDFPSLVMVTVGSGPVSTISADNSAELVNGVAVFKNLSLQFPGSYTLRASDNQGDLDGASNSFMNNGYQLVFRPEPGKAGVGAALRYTVFLENAKHQTVTADSTDFVMFTLNTVEGGANAALASAVSVLERGEARNESAPGAPAVSINSPGTYTLTATLMSPSGSAPTPYVTATMPGTSKEFNVVADQLVFHKVPAHSFVNIGLSYEVALEDYQRHTITSDSTDHLQFTLNTISGGVGAMLVNSTTMLHMGISDNSVGPTPLYITSPGTYTLTVTEIPAVPGDPVAPPATSKRFTVIKAAT